MMQSPPLPWQVALVHGFGSQGWPFARLTMSLQACDSPSQVPALHQVRWSTPLVSSSRHGVPNGANEPLAPRLQLPLASQASPVVQSLPSSQVVPLGFGSLWQPVEVL